MIRILLVDDHPVVRHGVRALLATQDDFTVVGEAATAEEAVRLVTTVETDIALVDLDLGTGEPDGVDATKGIIRGNPATRVIVFSAFDADADVVRAVEAGATGYLVKDIGPAELFRAVRDAARGAGALGGPAAAKLLERIRRPDESLTPRELEVLTLAATGLGNRELDREMTVSEATVKTHLHRIFVKLGVDSRQAAIAAAVNRGLIRF